jgi:hypothetical protein
MAAGASVQLLEFRTRYGGVVALHPVAFGLVRRPFAGTGLLLAF